MQSNLLSILKEVDFSQVKGFKSIHIDILNSIRDSILNDNCFFNRRWLQTFNSNLFTNNSYGLLNSIHLSIVSDNRNYISDYWLTFEQMKKLNEKGFDIKLKKGSKGAKVIFKSIYDKELKRNLTETELFELTPEEKNRKIDEGIIYFFIKEATVFNLDCFENIPEELLPKAEKKRIDIDIDLVNSLTEQMGVKVFFRHQNKAYYNSFLDSITLPAEEQFLSSDYFKATFFHELAHSTGHEKRLGRAFGTNYTKQYNIEEIIAELASANLSKNFNYNSEEIINSSAKYINHYAELLINSPKDVINAITKASFVSEYIL